MYDETTVTAPEDAAHARQRFEEHTAPNFIINPANGNIIMANPAAETFYGYPRDTLTNMNFADLYQLPKEQVMEQLAWSQEKYHLRFTVSHRLASGETRLVEVHSGPVTIMGVSLLYAIVYDVTEKAQAEAALQKRTEQLRLVYEAGQHLSQSLDLDTIYDTLYRLVAGIMDCDSLIVSRYNSADELIRCRYVRHEGQPLDASALPPIPLEPAGRGTQSLAIRTGQSLRLNDYQAHLRTAVTSYGFNAEAVMKTEDIPPEEEDITRSGLIVPLKLDGQVVGVVQVLSYRLNAYSEDDLWLVEALAAQVAIAGNNAALYRLSQEELAERRQAEEQFRVIFDGSPDVILILSGLGIIQNTNRAARDILGYESGALIGQHYSRFWPGERSLAHQWLQGLKDDSRMIGSTEILRADGTICPMDWTATWIPWGTDRAILATLHDVTERRLLEAERLKAERLHLKMQQERQMVEMREKFISVVSHEFRTPLAVIRSSSDLLERYRTRMTADQQITHLHEIQKQVQRLAQMTDDILKTSSAGAGKFGFEPAPLDLMAFCQMVLEQAQGTAQPSHHLIFTSDRDYRNIVLDEKLLSHILMNLVSNAIKYSPAGGQIRLHVFQEGRDLVFQVGDQGIGIPESELAKLFDPFHRGTNVGEIEGTGLGLMIVQECVSRHGGTITVQSGEGQGTTFTVRLPYVAATTG
ncbi:MAG TPA: PAS domain S-box protein [Phototrophicaceae bacterium]|nr:PAS domain S-box protein [Phototrophicaceae bacterium]